MKFEWNLEDRLQDLAGQAKRSLNVGDKTLRVEGYIFPGERYLETEQTKEIFEALPEIETFFGEIMIGYRALLLDGLHATAEKLEFDVPHVSLTGEASATKEFLTDSGLSALEQWSLKLGKAFTRSLLGEIGKGYLETALIRMKNQLASEAQPNE